MQQQIFNLKPFGNEHPDIEIMGEITRQDNHLQLSYKLLGDIERLAIPGLTAMPLRRNELWQHSCFEFFLGVQGMPDYWEFNLSPSGDWNVYRLSNYRENLIPELAYEALPFQVMVSESFCRLDLDLDLTPIVLAGQVLDFSITTVVEEQSISKDGVGQVSYWAIAHTGPEADFHRRDSFVLQL